ncbi:MULTISPECIES: MFS transporter [Paenibacillus]|uniref:MFS transporter n=1 Tax=Paenibacillus TaxID=44249 RepID=UPI00096CDAF9|nr:MFS transporter [Paenibacillus odorifer]OME08674.1 hypothetical protein BSK60_29570 [Paenibacillus odorifer]
MNFRRLLLILAVILASLNLRPAITSVSPILQLLTDQLHLNSAAASLLTSIPLLCIGICSLFAGRVSGRFGLERTIAFFLLLIGLATFLRFFMNNYTNLLLTALIAGSGVGIVSPLISGFIKQHFPNSVSLMIGIYSTSMVIGASLAIGLTVPLQTRFAGFWQGALGFWSLFAMLAVPVWLLLIRRPMNPPHTSVQNQNFSLPLKNKQAWLLTAFVGLITFLFYCFTAWMPAIVEEKGGSAAFAGLTGTVFMLAQLPATLLLPVLLRVFPSRRVWITFFTLSEIAGLSILCSSSITPIAAAACLGLGGGGLVSLALLLPIDKTATPAEASTWSAMTQAIGYTIGAVGPSWQVCSTTCHTALHQPYTCLLRSLAL